MRKSILLVLCCLLSTVLYAGPVSKEQACQIASQFLTAKGGAHRAPAQLVEQPPVLNAVDKAGNPYIYAFNAGHDAGYVLVSGDDRFVDVLGYSNSGSFDNDNMPDNMRAWLQGYVDEMKWAIANSESTDFKPLQSPRRAEVKKEIGPLMLTHWNQDAPYNNMTPYYYYNENNGNYSYSKTYVNGYSHCATGCVATAMAQAMYYNQWPVKAMTKGIPAYKWDSANIWLPGKDEVLPATTFDWNNMLEVYSEGHYTDVQANAVATLMKYCGYSVEMTYGASSGASTDMVADALKEYYDYSETTEFLDRSFYSYGDWIELLYHELAQNRVVVYSGQSSGGGHAFICDGYEGEDYFHINWGWGGSSDDYFKLSVLNPYEQGIGGSSTRDGFNFGQGAVVGIQKNGGEGTVLNVAKNNISLSVVSINADKTSAVIGEPVTVTVTVKNSGMDEYDGDILLYVPGIGPLTGKVFRIAAGETKDCKVIFTPSGYTGTFNIYAMRPVGGGSYDYIDKNEWCSVEVTEGTDNTGTNVTLTRTIEVENLVKDGNVNKVYGPASGNKFKATLTVTNTDTQITYAGYYQWNFYYADYTQEKWVLVTDKSTSVMIPANGGSVAIPVEVDGLPNNSDYRLRVVYYNGDADDGWSDWETAGVYHTVPAIASYDKDGKITLSAISSSYETPANALCVDLAGLEVSAVTPNSNPNTLYIIGSGQTAPTGASNVLRYDGSAYSASSIQLTDGKDFYSPVDFTAANIEFNYKFTVAADGTNGWNTIMLPFDVSEVTADGTKIDWFHSSTETGKNFWLKKFTSDDANHVYFDFTDEFKAYTPYIVAFPGNKWGAKWDMSNKVLKFKGTGAQVHSGDTPAIITGSSYRFVGSTQTVNTENIYTLNASGNNFVLNADGGSGAFRAFFKPGTYDYTVTSLSIGNESDHTTGVQGLKVEPENTKAPKMYNLNGQRVAQPKKGLYIVNGKKVMIK